MTIFGERYEIGALIGAGGMSDVFVAKDLRLNREVAVKVLRPNVRAAFAKDLAFMEWAATLTEGYVPRLRRLKPIDVVRTFAETVRLD